MFSGREQQLHCSVTLLCLQRDTRYGGWLTVGCVCFFKSDFLFDYGAKLQTPKRFFFSNFAVSIVEILSVEPFDNQSITVGGRNILILIFPISSELEPKQEKIFKNGIKGEG